MSVFDAYARYYDLFYRDKDYAAETDYVVGLIKRTNPRAQTILELGCGTGLHAIALAKRGYSVSGIDLSHKMLDSARRRLEKEPPEVRAAVSLSYGDARCYAAQQTFDCVLSLFHVASYQITNADVASFFNTAAAHLNRGGIFIFDFWYGPAVIFEGPQVRVKRFEDEITKITRIAEPQLRVNENRVDVNFEIHVDNHGEGLSQTISEIHPMRYFFMPEVTGLLEAHGFTSWRAEEWVTGRSPSTDTWGVCVTASR